MGLRKVHGGVCARFLLARPLDAFGSCRKHVGQVAAALGTGSSCSTCDPCLQKMASTRRRRRGVDGVRRDRLWLCRAGLGDLSRSEPRCQAGPGPSFPYLFLAAVRGRLGILRLLRLARVLRLLRLLRKSRALRELQKPGAKCK